MTGKSEHSVPGMSKHLVIVASVLFSFHGKSDFYDAVYVWYFKSTTFLIFIDTTLDERPIFDLTSRRLYTLLVLWCVCMLAPGIVVELGVFGPINMNTNIPGALALSWVIGYLA